MAFSFSWRFWRRKHQRKLVAVVPFRDEMRFLPDWFRNVSPHVDGVVALDDGSEDGSAEFVATQPSVLELIRQPRRPSEQWDCGANRSALFHAAGRHGADWIVGLDADERIERAFRTRAESEMDRLEASGWTAGSIRVRELWDQPDRMRLDGIWGQKAHGRLFAYRPDAVLDSRRFHGHWSPLDSRVQWPDGRELCPPLDLELYHLRMVRSEDRARRRDRYQQLDPDRKFQAMGYDYLTDPEGLVVESIYQHGRGYEPLPGDL